MYWDVVEAKPNAERTLSLRFANGLAGQVTFADDFFTGVFAPLRDPRLFAQAFVENGTVGWPGGIDLAPDALYEEVRLQISAKEAAI